MNIRRGFTFTRKFFLRFGASMTMLALGGRHRVVASSEGLTATQMSLKAGNTVEATTISWSFIADKTVRDKSKVKHA